ncbi:MAG: enoyl-CoA hydratase/isomerase family protein [Neisseriaceae bacterium]|nr:enoyl-CoA hydratase/isomerase family protein [Neisseriaceae bacterium]
MSQDYVHYDLIDAQQGRFALLTLDNSSRLNAHTTKIVREMHAYLDQIADDDSIQFVLIRGAGERAFCAGGDIRAVREGILNATAERDDGWTFFTTEYHSVRRLRNYPKPIISFAGGIVMGGGVGVMQASRYRIVTETSVFAMPESLIGLFADVAIVYFLSLLPKPMGLFLALTGAQLPPQSVLNLNLADFALPQADFGLMVNAFKAMRWQTEGIDKQLNLSLRQLARQQAVALGDDVTAGSLAVLQTLITADFNDTYRNLLAYAETGTHAWVKQACANIAQCSLYSLALHWLYFTEFQPMSYHAASDTDFQLAHAQCHRDSDFVEGVRARMVDKDYAPQWRWPTVDDIDWAELRDLFQ